MGFQELIKLTKITKPQVSQASLQGYESTHSCWGWGRILFGQAAGELGKDTVSGSHCPC